LVPVCSKLPDFAGPTDITLKGDQGKRLFAAMSLDEAEISMGTKVHWKCRDRAAEGTPSAQNSKLDPHLGELQSEKLDRLEMQFSGKAPRDPCASLILEADNDPLNSKEYEELRKERGEPILIPKRNPQEYINMGF